MKERRGDEMRLLRSLIAAFDNAEAVPVEGMHDHSRPHRLGEPSSEVARLEVDAAAVSALLAAEIDARLATANDYARHGRDEEAARLRAEAAVIGRYGPA
ncbi:MAG: hypothetical protein B7Z08_00530 [Sphingomonadales bacterium 32-68-7]|nr:MAG: hypothetical protein B7Z33_00670 [Sphingomonadales bacterium 12-68-11]OYX10510.1 MAG: hypothetical protein B7Z08_00530 [Sphingomonadales bacterium 32-68-7]